MSATKDKDEIYFHGIVGRSRGLRRVVRQIRDVAALDVPVLIQGESGVGKELVAHALHLESDRRSGPFIAVNAGAVPADLVASELFGHAKGSFTGATKSREGYFSAARGGTLFLDEIATMGDDMQVSLLRILETGAYTPVGTSDSRTSDARVIAATNEVIRKGRGASSIRRDLYYRLSVFVISIPPLRRRPRDIPALAHHVLGERAHELDLAARSFTQGAMRTLQGYSWPGNVRELVNVVTRAGISASGRRISREDVERALELRSDAHAEGVAAGAAGTDGERATNRTDRVVTADSGDLSPTDGHVAVQATADPGAQPEIEAGRTIESVEKQLIGLTLEHVDGNRTRAARMLGISRKALYNKIKRYQLSQ